MNSVDKKLSSLGVNGGGPMVPDTSRATLLPSNEPAPSTLQTTLVGQYKGFSIVPLSKPTTPLTPTRPAPVLVPSSAHRVSPPKVPANMVNQHHIVHPVRPAPKVPPILIGLVMTSTPSEVSQVDKPAPHRLAISSPVLDTTTSFTAKELIHHVSLRPAPSFPPQARPVSSPVSHEVGLETKVVKPKETSYPTLTRIASFMNRGGKGSQDVKKETIKSGKIDRDSLKNVQISNPILQKEINVPTKSLPAGEKAVIMRAQSLRSTGQEQRPAIPSFGSMRVTGNKRPTSIPAANRPSSPPPPRPPSIGVPGYQTPSKVDNGYDDCLNLLTEGVAPLANIDEESPCAVDNIYATIEESPTDRQERKKIVLPKKLEYTSPTGEYKAPKPIESSASAGSAESMGLLGEIVNEIQSRNTESIYSTNTISGKKDSEKDDDETSSMVTDSSSELDKQQMYVNTAWKSEYNNPPKSSASSTTSSSGYLRPINPNNTNKIKDTTTTQTVKVPETTAPHKPYVQKHSAILGAKLSTNEYPSLSENNKINTSETGVMKSNNITKQGSVASNANSVSNSNNLARKNSVGLSSIKPDLVSSCSSSGVKTPDVLGGKGDVKSLVTANGVTKPALSKPGSSFRGGRQPQPAPKPTVIPTTKTSITSQPLPAIPVGVKTKPVKTAKSESNGASTGIRPSSVASLQQKFEPTKQLNKPSVVTKGKTNANNIKSSTVKR